MNLYYAVFVVAGTHKCLRLVKAKSETDAAKLARRIGETATLTLRRAHELWKVYRTPPPEFVYDDLKVAFEEKVARRR